MQSLEREGIVYKRQDPSYKQKIIYLLTEKGIDLFPILLENAKWSLKYKSVDKEDAQILAFLLDGGEDKLREVMSALRETHQ